MIDTLPDLVIVKIIAKLIVLSTAYGTAAEPNRQNFHAWNSHGHVITLLMAIPDAEISAVRFFAVYSGWRLHSTTTVTGQYILQHKALSTLSQKSETVAEFGDSLTFLRQCGQGLSIWRIEQEEVPS